MPRYKKSLSLRFYTKYNKSTNGCWEWNGALRDDGYGILKVNNRCDGAHRFSYELYIGEIPNSLCVLHRCDNRKCVNPFHLFLGTKSDNMIDCIKKGRRDHVNYNFLKKVA